MKLQITLILFCWASLGSWATADDWPQWHGPHRDAKSAETGLLQEWPASGPKLAWRMDGLGGGYSAPSIAAGVIYGMSSQEGTETVWARSEEDGQELWTVELGSAPGDGMPQGREGAGCSPTVDGDKLYVIGLGGTLACLNAKDGKVVWTKSFTEDFGGIVPTWRFNESPLIVDQRLFCTPGGPEKTVVALDKLTGETIWTCRTATAEEAPEARPEQQRPGRRRGRSGPRSAAGYSSPIMIEEAGTRQVVQLTAKALVGIDLESGELLWKYEQAANPMGINCSTPIFESGLVFAASAYGNGGGAVRLTKQDDQISANEVYFTSRMQNHHGGMIVVDDCLYGANGGNGGGMLTCLDFASGEVFWRDREAPKGSLAFADGRLYLRSEEGEVVLIEPNKDRFVERGRFEQPDRTSSPAWTHPVIANGKLYIRDQDTLFCYDIAQ